LVRGIIRRIPNKTARRNPKPVLVPIHPALKDMLSTTPVDARGDYVLPEMATLYLQRAGMVTNLVQSHFQACEIVLHKPGTGMNGKRAVIEVGFHSLRHTFVSLCRESNAPLAVVESIVGHSNPAMTRHYTHVGEVAAGLAVAALPTVVGEVPVEPPKRQEGEILRKIKTTVATIVAENWNEQKAALLELLAKLPA
jgi:integrase